MEFYLSIHCHKYNWHLIVVIIGTIIGIIGRYTKNSWVKNKPNSSVLKVRENTGDMGSLR